MNSLTLAAITGQQLVNTVIWIIIVALIFWILTWAIGYIGIPEPFNKVIRVILAVFAALVLINVLLGLAGHQIVKW